MSRSPLVYLSWLLAMATATLLFHNPLYTLILLLIAQWVRLYAPHEPPYRLPFWRIGATMLIVSALSNAVFLHLGTTVLGKLPDHWPLIGGEISVEPIVMGLSNGLMLWSVFAIFSSLQQWITSADLIRLIPAAWQDLAIVLLIALNYTPQTLRHWQQIREAQAIRGHELRGWRDWQPLFIPLLIGGLERSMALAEAMTARGYGQTASRAHGKVVRIMLLTILAMALIGWMMAIFWGLWGWLVLFVSLVGLGGLLFWQGKQVKRTTYRIVSLHEIDYLLIATNLAPLVFLWTVRHAIAYTPFPTLTLPPFQPLYACVMLLWTLPIFFGRKK